MSPKNARLKTNGDQSSSATIRTDAIVGVEVSILEIGSEASSLLGGHARGSAYPRISILNILSKALTNCWIVVAASRAESARKYRSFIFYLCFQLTNKISESEASSLLGGHVRGSAYPRIQIL